MSTGKVNIRKFLAGLLITSALLCSIASCTPAGQAQLQTEVAPPLATAAADAKDYALTQAAELGETAIAAAGTEAVTLKNTALAVASTQAAAILTPEPPQIDYDFHQRDIILYNVTREIRLSEVAFKFSIPTEQLVALNQQKYPAITEANSQLQPDWQLVLYIGSPEHADLIPENAEAWNEEAGCVDSEIPIISMISCNTYTLDFVSEAGWNIGCIDLGGNPLGYYIVHSRYQGLMLFYSGAPFIYSLYYDEETNSVVIGPAIIQDKINLPECAIPGNP